MSLSLKLVLGEEIRKLHRLPATYPDLEHTLTSFYGHCNFSVKYIDEEGDHILVNDTDSLQTLYEIAESPSVKLYLTLHRREEEEKQPQHNDVFSQLRESEEFKPLAQSYIGTPTEEPVHFNVTCASCGIQPITGIRYKCTVCPELNSCAACEEKNQHPHSFVKIRLPDGAKWRGCGRFRGRGRRGCFRAPYTQMPSLVRQVIRATEGTEWEDIVKTFTGGFTKPWKVKLLEDVTLKNKEIVPTDVPVTKIWRVKNAGRENWPSGLRLVYLKGNLVPLAETVLPAASPGEVVDIETSFLVQNEGVTKGAWKIQSETKKFGKLKVNVTGVAIDPSYLEKCRQLVKMGFSIEKAKHGLHMAAGDLEIAVSEIFKTFT